MKLRQSSPGLQPAGRAAERGRAEALDYIGRRAATFGRGRLCRAHPVTDYYRLFLKRVGTDADFINVADPHDLEYTLKNLTPGTNLEVYVVPMNAGGPGLGSPIISKVVGA